MTNHSPVNVDRFLRTVLAVAEEHQITRAAERLGTAQPWVSRQLREVEEEIGVKLFKRIHSGVEATPSGEAFLDEARQAVFHSELFVARARAASASVLDRLLIGVSPTFDPEIYERIRQCMRAVLPRMQLAFDSKFVSEQVDGILRTNLHVGLAELPIHAERIQVLLLQREPMLLVGGHGEPLLAAASLHAENLNRKPCVILARQRNPAQRRIIEFLCRRGMEPGNLLEVLTLPEAFYPVMRGKAFAVLPPLARTLPWEGLTFRPIQGLQIGYGMIFHEDHRNAAMKTLLAAAQTHFAVNRAAIKAQKNGGIPKTPARATIC
jgi:DNA-binding transcriptional LysR family regulator